MQGLQICQREASVLDVQGQDSLHDQVNQWQGPSALYARKAFTGGFRRSNLRQGLTFLREYLQEVLGETGLGKSVTVRQASDGPRTGPGKFSLLTSQGRPRADRLHSQRWIDPPSTTRGQRHEWIESTRERVPHRARMGHRSGLIPHAQWFDTTNIE